MTDTYITVRTGRIRRRHTLSDGNRKLLSELLVKPHSWSFLPNIRNLTQLREQVNYARKMLPGSHMHNTQHIRTASPADEKQDIRTTISSLNRARLHHNVE